MAGNGVTNARQKGDTRWPQTKNGRSLDLPLFYEDW
jgi:hypothetical protein